MPQCKCIAQSTHKRCKRITKKHDEFCSKHKKCKLPEMNKDQTVKYIQAKLHEINTVKGKTA